MNSSNDFSLQKKLPIRKTINDLPRMKIDKITLCNLNSLKGKQTIDFSQEPLRSAGLFAITGDTGAGKSTLLDAICLALYGKAPRFDGAQRTSAEKLKQTEDENMRLQAGDPRNMLRRGEKEGFAQVEFTTQDGKKYEAVWSIRKKRTGTIDNARRTLRCLSSKNGDIDEREIPTRIVEIIGLDYTQFSRTVMLAQNSFANFLKAKREEKSMLLEKLTGTEIYGTISKKIFDLNNEAKKRVEAIENQIAGILRDKLAPEDVEEKNRQCQLLQTAIKCSKEQCELLQQQIEWLEHETLAKQKVKDCEAELHDAHKACVALRNDELRIERYDSVQEIQPTYQAITTYRDDISALKARETEIAGKIVVCKAQVENINTALQTARETLHQAETHLNHRRPTINQGHSLLGQIKEGEAQLQKLEEEANEARMIALGRKGQLETKREELRATSTQVENLQLHKQELTVHKQMFDKFDLVKDKLGLFQLESNRNAEQHQKADMLQKKLEQLSSSTQKLESEQRDLKVKLDGKRNEILVHQNSNSGIDGEYIQQRLTENESRLVKLEQAGTLWRRISNGYEEISEKQAEITRSTTEQEQLAESIAEMEKERQVAAEVCQRLNVALTLSQSQNIVQLRKQLKEGTACPVCGATHHPYHTETERELGELLNNLDKEHAEANSLLETKTKTLNDLRKQYAENAGRLQAETKALAARKQQQETDVNEWTSCASFDPMLVECSPTVNRNARRLMIEMYADNAKKAAQEAAQELKAFNLHQQAINRLNQEINELIQTIEDNRNQWQTLKTDQQIASTTLDEIQQTLSISDRTCKGLYVDLSELITVTNWISLWKDNPDGFKMQLVQMHQDWTQTCRELENALQHEARLIEEEKAMVASYEEAKRIMRRNEDSNRSMQENLQLKREELHRLFDGRTPEQEELTLQKNITEARALVDTHQREYERAESEINVMKGQQMRAADERQLKHEQLSARMRELDIWLLKFNTNHSPMQINELEDIFNDHTDWKKLRAVLEEKKQALHLANIHLDAARAALLELQTKNYRPKSEEEMSREYLTIALQHQTDEMNRQSEELSTLRVILSKHHNCIQDADRLTTETAHLREDAENWNRLSSLLGSSDGKKFRELAQSFTFGFLMDQANYHLRQLSPRYELRAKTGELSLTVIDHDMFDEERHIQSLSGGETFIASLALALGLASLSSGQISIGSLFIDEGFGNLDQASLQLVMDALSRLETTQGRKVGVVSHTHQIREQIHPQIRIVKHATGGESSIEVK